MARGFGVGASFAPTVGMNSPATKGQDILSRQDVAFDRQRRTVVNNRRRSRRPLDAGSPPLPAPWQSTIPRGGTSPGRCAAVAHGRRLLQGHIEEGCQGRQRFSFVRLHGRHIQVDRLRARHLGLALEQRMQPRLQLHQQVGVGAGGDDLVDPLQIRLEAFDLYRWVAQASVSTGTIGPLASRTSQSPSANTQTSMPG